MEKRLRLLCLLFILMQFPSLLKAQEFVGISQYMYHKQFYNPAAMSSHDEINAVMLYRNQWVGIDGAPSVYSLNASVPFNKAAVGIGVFRSTIGVHQSSNFFASYSYRVKLGYSKYLAFGFSAGLKFNNMNYQEVDASEINDHYFSSNIKSNIVPQFQFGVFYFSNKYYIGLSIPSVISDKIEVKNNNAIADYSYESKNLRFYLNGGYEYDINEEWRLNFSSLLKYETNSPLDCDFSIMSSYNDKIGLGFSYRLQNEWMALVNLRMTENFRFGYAYHMTNISSRILNSHELILLFSLNKKKRGRLRIQSPRF